MCAPNPGVNVIALLKIDVLKEIPIRACRRNRVAVHFYPIQMRDRTLNWLQPLAKIVIEYRRYAGAVPDRVHCSFPWQKSVRGIHMDNQTRHDLTRCLVPGSVARGL